LSIDRFYRIQNHEDGYPHLGEKVRQYRYELVNEVMGGHQMYGFLRYVNGPYFLHRGFYHVPESDLADVWWKMPSPSQKLEIIARYPEVTF